MEAALDLSYLQEKVTLPCWKLSGNSAYCPIIEGCRTIYWKAFFSVFVFNPHLWRQSIRLSSRSWRSRCFTFLSYYLVNRLANGNKIAFYCSDVSGAFDKVDADRLLMKLRYAGISSSILNVLRSWLSVRQARVVMGGS